MKDTELIEKWFVVGALMGVNVQELWDSLDDDVEESLEYLEQLERLELDTDRPGLRVARKALEMGISTNMLTKYSENRDKELQAREAAELLKDETENPLLCNLRNTHRFEITTAEKIRKGDSVAQRYWRFIGDIGQGLKTYNCRYVQITWTRGRVWFEENDKNRSSFDCSRYDFKFDERYPKAWQSQGHVTHDQVMWIATQQRLDQQAKKLSSQLKAKATRDAKKQRHPSTVQGL